MSDPTAPTAPSPPPSPPTPRIRVGGVPEHFNFPWHLAQQEGLFAQHNVEVEFVEMRTGTGAMIEALKHDELDLVIALTEGLVADIARGSDLRLLGTYVSSPLCWAVSVAGAGGALPAGRTAPVETLEDLRGATFGVSRLASGSHLMAVVLAAQRGWDPQRDVHFAVQGGLDALLAGVNAGASAAFLWETFTTKPYHDAGTVRRVGEVTTPWPCFMVAARTPTLDAALPAVQRVLAAVHEAARRFHATPAAYLPALAARYGLAPADAAAWFATVHIAAERFVSEAALARVVDTLCGTGVLPAAAVAAALRDGGAALLDPRVAQLRHDLSSMRLYRRPELLLAAQRQARHAGLGGAGPLAYTQLLPFDQHHYGGAAAVAAVADAARLSAASRVVQLGAGLGGPARLLAGSRGCHVLACEVQADLARAAAEWTARCGLAANVTHVTGDAVALAPTWPRAAYDLVASWLTLLHVADRATLLRQCHELLTPGGTFYAADLFQAGALTPAEWTALREDVAVASLPGSLAAYVADLEAAGLRVTRAADVTAEWTVFTRERAAAFAAQRAALEPVIGADVYESLARFYAQMASLFAGGHLGGIEVYATRPLGW